MCDCCVEWDGKRWHRYRGGYYERTDKSVRPKKTRRLHRMVWEAAFGPIPAGHDIHHANHDVGDNRIENLECLPHGKHAAHHTALNPIPRQDWDRTPAVSVACCRCGDTILRKRPQPDSKCRKCKHADADNNRKRERECQHCGTSFRSRAGNFCSQRCVNLATAGATTCVLPEDRRRT